MNKYAVEQDETTVKTAKDKPVAQCPACGTQVVAQESTNVLMCPKCGTKAFEVPQ